MYVRLVPNFMGFAAIGLLVVAMVGVGVAEEAGLVKALIRKLVAISPRWALTYILASSECCRASPRMPATWC